MRSYLGVCVATAILSPFILHPTKLMASSPSVPPGACMYALDPAAADAFQIAGAQSVYTACGVVSESSSSSAFEMEGAETLYLENHAQVSVVGGADLTGQTYLYDTIGGKDVSAVKTSNPGDPLSSLSPPTSGAMVGKSPTYYDMNSKPANNTISAGIYCGGLTIGNTNGATFTFSPGVYIIAGGGLTLESEAVVKGTGVTFYNTSSAGWGCSSSYNYTPITISGQVNATFSAPTSGAFDGILFFGNRTGCSTAGSCVDQINGGSTAILNGALYFKSDKIEITGSNASGYTMLVADKIYINGNSNFGENGSPFDDITVSVSPAAASIFASQTQQFTATVDNTGNTAVTWTISPASVGSISSSGLYTAPSSITAQQTVTVTATSQADNTKTGKATIALLPPQTPVITWVTPAAITYGTALSATQLDATANVPGTFTYTPAAGTVLAARSQTLTVTFTPTNTAEYTTATAGVMLTVNKATPVITWATPAAITYGTALTSTQLDATANVAGAFAYSPSAGTVLPVGSQTLNVTFTPSDTTDYATATASVPLTVNLATPTISVANLPASGIYGGSFTAAIAYSGNGSPTEAIASSTPSVCTVNGMLVSYVGAGACSLTASASATADYGAVTGSAQSFTVGQATLTVKASSPTVIYGSAAPAIAPSYSGFVNGDTASVLNAAPACTTTYTTTSPVGSSPSTNCSGAAAANYMFTYVNGSVNVTQASQTITFAAPASPVTYGASAMALNASASSSLAVSFSASGPCSVSGSTLTITGAGTCTVTVSQAGNSNYEAATAVSHNVAVIPAPLTITASSAAATYGAAVPAITPSYAGFVNGDTASALTTAPTCSTTYTTASATGSYPSSCSGAVDANYAISYVSGAVTVNQTTPAIAWATPAAIAYGTPLSATQLDAAANVPGTFTYSPAAGTVPAVGSQTLTATFTPTDTTDYATATASVVLMVNQATPTITWTTPTAITAGTALGSTQLDATVNVAGTFAYSPAAGTVLSAGNQTLNVTFTPTDITDYATATASVVLTVNQATQCNTNGYGYVRAIVIDHTKVPNTDQIDFPFLFSTTDPLLATTANGGHITNENAYDLIFTSDAAGLNPLPYEMEKYDPQTGTVIAWVQIPKLSHTADTVIYLFYGNTNVTTTQQNPSAVWDSNYKGVWHLGNTSALSLNDSTSDGNNATDNGAVFATGPIAGGMQTNGSTYATIGTPSSLANLAQGPATFSVWVNSAAGAGGILMGKDDHNVSAGWSMSLTANHNVEFVVVDESDFEVESTETTADNAWSYVVVTLNGSAAHSQTGTFYINGVPSGSSGSDGFGGTSDDSAQVAYLANAAFGNQGSAPFNGMTAEFRMSNTIRSADWIATEYANQNSPSTFSSLSPESQAMNPGAVRLYASQSQQFAVLANAPCNASVVWSISPSSSPLEVGTLTQTGPYSVLYTAPANIASQQSVTITAAVPGSSYSLATAIITLMPSIGVSITPPTAIVYPTQTQQFTATVSNTTDTAVNWTISPAGIGTINANGIYTPPNINFAAGKFTATSLVLNAAEDGDPIVTPGGVLQLTDGGRAEDASAWYPAKVPVTAFSTNFSFQMLPSSGITFADGITFTIQGNGTNALGGGGGGLGYQGISDSVAIKFDTFNNSGEGTDSTGIFTDGTGPYIPAIDLTPTGIELQSGDVIDANLVYDSRNLTLMLADTVTQATAQEVFPIDIPSVLGSDTAYIGFTGSTGVGASTQNVLSWTYTSSSPKTIDVTATSAADSAVSATASVTLMPSIAISASPANVVLYGGQSQQFTANVTNTANTAVIWSIAPATGTGSIDASGLYSAPSAVTAPQTVTITAASVADPSVTTTLTLTLVPHVALSINPTGTTLFAGQSLQFTANVTGNSDTAVIWTVIPAPGTILANGLGTLNAGLYTAPASVPSEQALLITATSAANPTISATATVTLMPAQNAISINLATTSPVTYPNSAQLTATVTDSSLPLGQTLTVQWTQLSGPGTITFGSAQTTSTTASFSEIGTYVVQLTASDSVNSTSARLAIVVSDSPSLAQGWIGSPANGSGVSGIVPITVASGETLTSGTLAYYPANNPNDVVVLNSAVSASSGQQIGTLDTTTLANGSYWITLQATDNNGDSQYSLALVTVTGNYKPGRITTTVTDLVVPATGLPIQIQRTYDSLNAATVGDFGYGWNLGINTNLTVDNKGNVTFTLGGQRKTFYLTPTSGGFLFPWYFPTFTPEPGLFGTLTDSGPGCVLDMLLPDGECLGGIGFYTPPGYIYTDPNGTSYTIGAGGQLQSIVDRSGNGLTIGPNGITSTTGLNVPFVRDAENRITQITDPAGNVYSYNYDANGDLVSVTYPPAQSSQVCAGASAPNTSQYTYAPNHYYESGTDGNCNPLPSTTYYAAGETDASGNYSVAGKLQSVTDGLGETTGYTYNLATNTTVVTYPPDAQGNIGTATMVYDSNGDVLSSTDPLGHTTTNTYDTNFNLLSTTDPLGHTTSYTYDANGNKLSTTYPATAASTNTTSATNYNQFSEPTSTLDEDGNTRTFAYDANFNPLAVTDAVGTLMSTTFNAAGQMLSGAIGYDITQNPANASQFAYDANGNLTSKTDALGRTTSYTYNALGQKITMTEPVPAGSTAAQATTTYTYDAFGNVIETQAPLGRTTSSTYDANGNKLSDTDARSNTTNYKYDALNRLIETDYPGGTKATKTYDFRNNVVTETDQNGHVTLHQYDLAGRQTSVTQAYGTANATTTTTAYDNAGRMTSQTDALGHTTSYTYDAAGNLLSTSGVAGNFTYVYDNARNRIAMTDGDGHTTQYQYDARKRLTVTTYPDATTKTNAYDGPGNLVSVTDQAGNVVDYTYDAANQLSNVTESPSASVEETTIYGYDANGNPIALEDANQHTTSNAFDLLSELTNKTLPDGTLTESRTYDANGNLSTVTHFNNVTTSYTYDQLNRLLSRATPGEAPVSFTYTATGKYLTSTAGDGTVNYAYDSLDRLLTKATPEGTLSYTYYPNGKVQTIASSNSNGVSIALTWDELNRLSTVIDNRLPSGANTATYTYDPAGNVATATYPNGFQTTFTYDQLSRLAAMSTQVSSYNYQRGPTGNLLSTSESSGRQVSWTYDGIYRLTNETISLDPSHNNGAASYGFDPVGNRLSANSTLPGINPIAGTYNADDELSSETYDANGNVLSADGVSYSYDSENHMISETGNGKVVTMVYDAFGNRVSKTVNGVTTQYLVEDDVNPTGLPQVLEEVQNGAAVRTYTYGLQCISESQEISNVWTPSFYVYDGAGSVRQLTNSAGVVTDTYEYDAYGNSFTTQGSTPNNYLYRGEQFDPDLGLYYLRARYYSPLTGRFMSRDPEDGKLFYPASLHKYLYAQGDPVNRLDPMGKEALIGSAIQVAVKYGAYVALAGVAASIVCEFMEDAEAIREASEASADASVRASPSGAGCGGPHPAPGGPGHPDGPEPGPGPDPTPIYGPPVAGSD